MIGCIVGMFTLKLNPNDKFGNSYGYYTFMLVLSSFLNVVSHTTKEAIVRS